MVTGTLDLGKRITFPDGEEEEMSDRDDEKEEDVKLREIEAMRAKGMQGMPSLLRDQADAQREVLGPGPLPHDRCHFLALGFMSYVMEGEANPKDVEMLADLLRQEALR